MASPGATQMEEQLESVEDVVEDVFPALVGTVVVSAILLIMFVIRVFSRWGVPCPSDNRLEGKVVVITGSNNGLGKATAIELAKRGARIILACRDHKKGEAIARTIKKKTKNSGVYSMKLDLASLHSIRDFVEDFNQKESHLHILINNGAYMGPKLTTEDGIERNFGVNYLGHFYLTYLLVDKLKRCAPCRVINVVSDASTSSKLDLEDLPLAKGYGIYPAYARSKVAMLVHTIELHRRFFRDVVLSFAVNPGAANTDLLRNWPGMYGNVLRMISRFFFRVPEDACQTIVYCAVGEKIKHESGRLFQNCKRSHYKDYVRDKEIGERLWNTSLHLCGLDQDIPEPTEEKQ